MSEISKINNSISIKKIDQETIGIQILQNEMLRVIVGQFNQNLNELEKLTKCRIFFRGNSITLKGKLDNIKLASEAIRFLGDKYLLTNSIEKNDIILSVKKNINSDTE